MADFPEFVITLSHNKSNEKQVTLAFTIGLKALEKGQTTSILLMLDGVYVGKANYVDDIDIGEPFLPVKDMLDVFLSQGGEVRICGSCWNHEHLTDADRAPGLKMISADVVVDYLLNAKATLQLN